MLGLGLEDKMDVKVGVLSGGQRQAMALLMSTMTPIDAMNTLYRLQTRLKNRWKENL